VCKKEGGGEIRESERERRKKEREGRNHKEEGDNTIMLCCMRRTKQVEKNDDIDQKIEQDGIKPEDKAHKAAIKIQASFRGHITRKKLKGEKKGDAQATDVEGGEKKEEVLVNGLADGKTAITEVAAAENALPGDESKGESTPADEKQADGTADSGSEQPVPKATTPAAPPATETESATKDSTDNSPSLKADEAQVKEEPKQADVPATATTALPLVLQKMLLPRQQRNPKQKRQ